MSLKTEKIAVVDNISTVCNYLKKKASGTEDEVKEEWLTEEADGSDCQASEPTRTDEHCRPFDKCHVSLSPFGDVLAVGRVDRVVVLRGRCSSRHPTRFSVKNRRILRLTSSLTSLLCLPLGSSQSSMTGCVDWTCVAAGMENGSVSFHTEDGHLLCSVAVLDTPVLELRCTARSGCDLGHYLYSVGEGALTLLDVSQVCGRLKFLRSQLAKHGTVKSDGGSSWTPRRMRVIFRNHTASFYNHSVQSAALVGERSAQLLDHLWQLSRPEAGGEGGEGVSKARAVSRATVPSGGVVVTTGVTPFVGVCHVENIIESVDMEQVACQVASGFLQTIMLSARTSSSAFVDLSISNSVGVWDEPRAGQRVTACHNGRYCAISDSLGRVSLLDCHSATVVRMWKGYRDAQCGWLLVDEPYTPSNNKNNSNSTAVWCDSRSRRQVNFLLVYLPARGLLQVWLAANGACVAVCSVAKHGLLLHIEHTLLDPEHTFWSPLCSSSASLSTSSRASVSASTPMTMARPGSTLQCVFLSPSGSLYSVSVPFHLALGSDKRSHDAFALGQLDAMLSSRGAVTASSGGRLATRLAPFLATLRTVSARQQALASVVSCTRLDTGTVLAALDALHRSGEEKPRDIIEVKCWQELTSGLTTYRRLINSLTTLNSLCEKAGCYDNERRHDSKKSDLVDSIVSWMRLSAPLSSTLRHILSTNSCDITSTECVGNSRVTFDQPESVSPASFLSYLSANTASALPSKGSAAESRTALAHLIFAGFMLSETSNSLEKQQHSSIASTECNQSLQGGAVIVYDSAGSADADRKVSLQTLPETGGDEEGTSADNRVQSDVEMKSQTDECQSTACSISESTETNAEAEIMTAEKAAPPGQTEAATRTTEIVESVTKPPPPTTTTTERQSEDNVLSKSATASSTETIAPHRDKSSAVDWLSAVRCLELPVSRLAALLAQYWLSLTGEVVTCHVTWLYRTLLTVCTKMSQPSDKLMWKELVELISASQHVGRAFVMAAVCRSVVITMEQNNQECGRSKDSSDVACSDEATMEDESAASLTPDCDWESLSVLSIGWDLLLHQLADTVTVCDVIETDKSEAPVTLTRLLQSGPGCVSELLARQMISASITAHDLTVLRCDEEGTDAAELTVTDHVVSNTLTDTESRDQSERRQKLKDWTTALSGRFRYSVAVDNLAVNCVWALVNAWSRRPADTHMLLRALEFVDIIESLRLRQGVCMLVWSAFLRSPVTILFNMLNEGGRLPDDSECVGQLKMSLHQIPEFTKAVVQLLDIISTASEAMEMAASEEISVSAHQPAPGEGGQCDDLWTLTSLSSSSPPGRHRRVASLSLTEMCLHQQQQHYQRLIARRSETPPERWRLEEELCITTRHCVHWQLACALCVIVCLRTMSEGASRVMPGQMFDRGLLSEVLFEPDANNPERGNRYSAVTRPLESLTERIARKRHQFIDDAVARATALISQSESTNKMADIGETLAWTAMLDGLCTAWSIDHYSQQEFVVALFSHALDSLGYEVWRTVPAEHLQQLETKLLNVARSRIRSLLNIQLQNSSARLESIVPNSTVINSIKTCVFPLENYCVSMQETQTLLRALTRVECQQSTIRKAGDLLQCAEQLNL